MHFNTQWSTIRGAELLFSLPLTKSLSIFFHSLLVALVFLKLLHQRFLASSVSVRWTTDLSVCFPL